MRDLRGKVVLLTGASRGIGVYIARLLAGRGARLALVARSAQGLSEIARELKFLGDGISLFLIDHDMGLALVAYNRGPGRVAGILAMGGDPANGSAEAVVEGWTPVGAAAGGK